MELSSDQYQSIQKLISKDSSNPSLPQVLQIEMGYRAALLSAISVGYWNWLSPLGKGISLASLLYVLNRELLHKVMAVD